MKRYNIAELRAHLAGALDEVEKGETVIVERRGRRFRLVPEPLRTPSWPELPAQVEILDPAVLGGEWGWEWTGPGEPLAFTAREPGPEYGSSAAVERGRSPKPGTPKRRTAKQTSGRGRK